MRQHDIIFDVENKKIGVARAQCSPDPNFIHSAQDYRNSGRNFGLKLDHLTNFDVAYKLCNHTGSLPGHWVKNIPKEVQPDPYKRYEPYIQKHPEEGHPVWALIGRIVAIFASIFLLVFCYSLCKESYKEIKRKLRKRRYYQGREESEEREQNEHGLQPRAEGEEFNRFGSEMVDPEAKTLEKLGRDFYT